MSSPTPESTTYILVTGANNGLGLGICKRLLSEFLTSRPATQHIHVIASTRSAAKSTATLATLRAHLRTSPRLKAAGEARATLSSVELDLTQLASVRAAAARLAAQLPRLDVVVCNAGIAGEQVIDYLQAVPMVLRHPIEAVTFPEFARSSLSTRAAPQFGARAPAALRDAEPPLGEVFAANVLGHYLLVHGLARLLRTARRPGAAVGRVVWVSSHDTDRRYFALDDIQALGSRFAYRSSKRLTDLLVLSSDTPAAAPSVRAFWTPPAAEDAALPASGDLPGMYLAHPGVVGTDIYPLHPVAKFFKFVAFYLARWLGSPWHNITPAAGAHAPTWLALAPAAALQEQEGRDGKAKWGSATDRWGAESVRRGEVDGWGWGGRPGGAERWAPGDYGRRAGAQNVTAAECAAFVESGAKTWEAMERVRVQWESLLDRADDTEAAGKTV